MNILVLERDLKELAFLQQVLSGKKHEILPVLTSDQALQAIQAGVARCIIVNWDTSDAQPSQLIQRIRASNAPEPVYVLLVTTRTPEEDPTLSGMDDLLHRPFKSADLKNRITIAERIMLLTSKLTEARTQLENHAAFDPLTEFMNRTAFVRQSTGELERSRRASMPLSMIALDIENFSLINQKFGIKIGDDVLRVVAKSIRDKSRPYDCIGRWAGDEFVLALPGVIGADGEKVAGRIIAGVRGTRIEVPNEPPLNVKISAGVASIMRITTTTEIEPIIEQARQAVRRAKEAGGNQVFLSFI